MSVGFVAKFSNRESAILVKGIVSNPSLVTVYIAITGLLRSNFQRILPNLSKVTTRPVELVVKCNKSKNRFILYYKML